MKNEIMEMLKNSGAIEKFVNAHKHATEEARRKNDNENWKPDENVIELASQIALSIELCKNEELREKFAEYANELATNEITKEIVKITMTEDE